MLQFAGDPAPLGRAVTSATHQLDSDLALDTPQTLEQQLTRQTAPRRVTLALTGAFAATVVALAALGIFGVMSFTVAHRTREIGVRLALGASPTHILRWLFRYGGGAIGAGLIAGMGLTVATGQLLRSLLTGMTTLDPGVIAAAAIVLAVAGLAACLLPALRATRVDPVQALRSE